MSNTYASAWCDDDVAALAELADKFFAKNVVPQRDRWDAQHHVDREVWLDAGRLGLLHGKQVVPSPWQATYCGLGVCGTSSATKGRWTELDRWPSASRVKPSHEEMPLLDGWARPQARSLLLTRVNRIRIAFTTFTS